MTDLLALSVFGVDWQFLKPFIVIGLAFGGVYALSGVGLVVLYRATGVLNLAFGAIGAAGALIAYYLINHTSCPEWLAFTVCVAAGGVVNLAYGMVFGPAFARRDPLVKMMGTLGLALILLGLMAWRAPAGIVIPTIPHIPVFALSQTCQGRFLTRCGPSQFATGSGSFCHAATASRYFGLDGFRRGSSPPLFSQ